MSLYHQLETVEIPSIVAFKPSQYLESYGVVKPRLEFAPTPTQLFESEDPQTVLQKEQPAQLVQPTISVAAVTSGPDTFVAADRRTQMQNNAPRRLTYNNDDVPAFDEEFFREATSEKTKSNLEKLGVRFSTPISEEEGQRLVQQYPDLYKELSGRKHIQPIQ